MRVVKPTSCWKIPCIGHFMEPSRGLLDTGAPQECYTSQSRISSRKPCVNPLLLFSLVLKTHTDVSWLGKGRKGKFPFFSFPNQEMTILHTCKQIFRPLLDQLPLRVVIEMKCLSSTNCPESEDNFSNASWLCCDRTSCVKISSD